MRIDKIFCGLAYLLSNRHRRPSQVKSTVATSCSELLVTVSLLSDVADAVHCPGSEENLQLMGCEKSLERLSCLSCLASVLFTPPATALSLIAGHRAHIGVPLRPARYDAPIRRADNYRDPRGRPGVNLCFITHFQLASFCSAYWASVTSLRCPKGKPRRSLSLPVVFLSLPSSKRTRDVFNPKSSVRYLLHVTDLSKGVSHICGEFLEIAIPLELVMQALTAPLDQPQFYEASIFEACVSSRRAQWFHNIFKLAGRNSTTFR